MAWLSCFDVVPVFALPCTGWEVSSADISEAAGGHVTPSGSASTMAPQLALEELIAFLKRWLHLRTEELGHLP